MDGERYAGDHLLRRDAGLGPEVAYGADHILNEVHLREHLFVDGDARRGPAAVLHEVGAEGEGVPELLSYEGNDRVEQLEDVFKYGEQDGLRRPAARLSLVAAQSRL